jgi:small subunit ribosomal protein S16
MSVKIRLQRHGRKKSAFFHIVVADSRAPRNGRFIEKLGIYNPNTNPATIDLNFDSTLNWVQDGAVPSDTCRAILSYKGVMMKHHLLNGVKKGAHTEEQAEEKFQAWLTAKTEKVTAKTESITSAKESKRMTDLAREAKISEERAAKIAEKNTPPADEVEEVAPAEEGTEATEAVAEETATAEVEAPATEEKEEEPKAEEAPEEEATPVAEEKAEEPKAEEAAPTAEEKAEEPKAEAEAPAEEAKEEEK